MSTGLIIALSASRIVAERLVQGAMILTDRGVSVLGRDAAPP